MDSISLPKILLLPFSNSLNPRHPSPSLKTLQPKFSPFALTSLRSAHRRLSSVPRPAAISGSGGGGGSGGVDLSGGGDGDEDGGGRAAQSRSVAVGETEEVPDLGNDEDAIVLSVGGMSCGGCAASVKRILESQPQVSTATVSFEKATAVVWVISEVKVTDNWRQELGEKLANHLTTCGFKSNLQAAVPDMLLKSEISSIPRPFSNYPKQFHARVLSIQAELVHYETDKVDFKFCRLPHIENTEVLMMILKCADSGW